MPEVYKPTPDGKFSLIEDWYLFLNKQDYPGVSFSGHGQPGLPKDIERVDKSFVSDEFLC